MPPLEGEALCGLDDGPVHVGAQETASGGFLGIRLVAPQRPPPPVTAAPPWPDARWSLDPDVEATRAFARRAATCAEAATAGDAGEHPFTVRFGRAGQATSVRRHDAAVLPSSLRTCFQAALCETKRAPTATSPSAMVKLIVDMKPPLFQGSVDVSTLEESPGLTDRDGRSTGRKVPRRSPWSAAEHRWYATLQTSLAEGMKDCARRTPPDDTLSLTVRFHVAPRTGKLVAPASVPGQNAFEREMARCFGAVVVRDAPATPPTIAPNGGLTFFVTFTVEQPRPRVRNE